MKKIPVECYSRVCGFFRPVSNFNPGKKAEFEDRRDLLTGEYIVKKKQQSEVPIDVYV